MRISFDFFVELQGVHSWDIWVFHFIKDIEAIGQDANLRWTIFNWLKHFTLTNIVESKIKVCVFFILHCLCLSSRTIFLGGGSGLSFEVLGSIFIEKWLLLREHFIGLSYLVRIEICEDTWNDIHKIIFISQDLISLSFTQTSKFKELLILINLAWLILILAYEHI